MVVTKVDIEVVWKVGLLADERAFEKVAWMVWFEVVVRRAFEWDYELVEK